MYHFVLDAIIIFGVTLNSGHWIWNIEIDIEYEKCSSVLMSMVQNICICNKGGKESNIKDVKHFLTVTWNV